MAGAAENPSKIQPHAGGACQDWGPRIAKYREPLKRLAQKIIVPWLPSVEASDVAQEALLAAWKYFLENGDHPAATDEARLCGWLYLTLRRKAIDAVRRVAASPRPVPLDESLLSPGRELAPPELYEMMHDHERLDHAMKNIDIVALQILIWRHDENVSYAEIGRRLGGYSDRTGEAKYRKAVEHLYKEFKSPRAG